MDLDKEREQQWTAYFMGDLGPEDRACVERELGERPAEAEAFRAVVDGVAQWAAEGVEHAPLDLEHLDLDAQPIWAGAREHVLRRRGKRSAWPWAALLASAALFLLALSQVHFTLQLGNTALNWGRTAGGPQSAPETSGALEGQVAALSERIQGLEQANGLLVNQVQSLALQDTVFEDQLRNTALRLAQNQRIETQTRYREMQSLYQLAAYSRGAAAE